MINLEMPEDVQNYVREYQGRTKAEREVGQYSLQKCIIAIIREHKILTEKIAEIKEIKPPLDD